MDYSQERLGREGRIADYSLDTSIRRGPLDIPFFLLVLMLLTIGVVMLLSASYARAYYSGNTPTYYFTRQLIFAVAGIAAMLFLSRLPMGFYRRWSMWVLAAALFLLLLVPVIGTASHGPAAGWKLAALHYSPPRLPRLVSFCLFHAHLQIQKRHENT